VQWNWQEKSEVLGEKPVPVPFRPPQIPHGLTRDRTRASAVGGRRLTASAMARLFRAFYEKRKFIIAFVKAHCCFLSAAGTNKPSNSWPNKSFYWGMRGGGGGWTRGYI
jgi:hypothetical protein